MSLVTAALMFAPSRAHAQGVNSHYLGRTRLHSYTSPSNMIHRACRPKSWCRSDAPVVVNALLRLLLPSRSIHSRLSRHQRHRKQRRECR